VAQPETIKAKNSSAMRPHLAIRRAYRKAAPVYTHPRSPGA
jgi:hypothetical protein